MDVGGGRTWGSERGDTTLRVRVFHVRYEGPNPVHIATVEAPHINHTEACEYAYRWTQNIEDSWSKKMPRDGNDAVTVEVPVGEYGHRSTAVGDYFEVEDQFYKCSAVGFERALMLSWQPPDAQYA